MTLKNIITLEATRVFASNLLLLAITLVAYYSHSTV
jgi:hypothetical protein